MGLLLCVFLRKDVERNNGFDPVGLDVSAAVPGRYGQRHTKPPRLDAETSNRNLQENR